jgi:hypothetical protein
LDARCVKWRYIEKFAIAQSILGVESTIAIKRRVVGKKPLIHSSENELKRIINLLRKEYRRNDHVNQKKHRIFQK